MNKNVLFLIGMLSSACALNGMETDRVYEQLQGSEKCEPKYVSDLFSKYPRTTGVIATAAGVGLGIATRKYAVSRMITGAGSGFVCGAILAGRLASRVNRIVDEKHWQYLDKESDRFFPDFEKLEEASRDVARVKSRNDNMAKIAACLSTVSCAIFAWKWHPKV